MLLGGFCNNLECASSVSGKYVPTQKPATQYLISLSSIVSCHRAVHITKELVFIRQLPQCSEELFFALIELFKLVFHQGSEIMLPCLPKLSALSFRLF